MSGKSIHRFPWPVRLIIGLVILGIILYAGVMGFVLIREKGVATRSNRTDRPASSFPGDLMPQRKPMEKRKYRSWSAAHREQMNRNLKPPS